MARIDVYKRLITDHSAGVGERQMAVKKYLEYLFEDSAIPEIAPEWYERAVERLGNVHGTDENSSRLRTRYLREAEALANGRVPRDYIRRWTLRGLPCLCIPQSKQVIDFVRNCKLFLAVDSEGRVTKVIQKVGIEDLKQEFFLGKKPDKTGIYCCDRDGNVRYGVRYVEKSGSADFLDVKHYHIFRASRAHFN